MSSSEQSKNTVTTSNEILSSHVSCGGNVMSLVVRSSNNQEKAADPNAVIKSFKKTPRSSRVPARKYRPERNVNRSANFWALYNNFILCNRSIELRITKLYSFHNTQYIVAFSNDFFDCTGNIRTVPLKRKISHERCCVIQYMQFNVSGCICEVLFVEHSIELWMLIRCNDKRKLSMSVPLLVSKFSCIKSAPSSEVGSNGRIYRTMALSVLVLSVGALFVYLSNCANFFK